MRNGGSHGPIIIIVNVNNQYEHPSKNKHVIDINTCNKLCNQDKKC
jgi:hypothetical protein